MTGRGSPPAGSEAALVRAVKGGRSAEVARLLAAGADPDTPTAQGTVLDLALSLRHDEVACVLVEAGADVASLRDRLAWAVGTGRPAVVRALLAAGADLRAETPRGRPLAVAVRPHGTPTAIALEIVGLLLDAGADINVGSVLRTPLLAAIEGGESEIAQTLIAAGARLARDPAIRQFIAPLALAAHRGDAVVVRALLAAGAEVDALGSDVPPFRASPLVLAATAGHPEVVRALLAAGADTAARDALDRTAWECARDNDHEEVAALLAEAGAGSRRDTPDDLLLSASERGDLAEIAAALASGARWTAGDRRAATEGLTALMLAARAGQVEAIRALVSAGAPVEARLPGTNERMLAFLYRGELAAVEEHHVLGRTALHFAARAGHRDAVRALLELGADVEAPAALGLRPLHLAAMQGDPGCVRALLEAGAGVDARDCRKTSALSLAVGGGHAEATRLLAGAGANVSARSGDGAATPIEIAAARGDRPVLLVLLAARKQKARPPRLGVGVLVEAAAAARWVTIPSDQAVRGGGGAVQWGPGGVRALRPIPEDEALGLVDALLEAGAVPGAAKGGRTPLMAAAASGYPRVVNRLLAAGDSLDARDDRGWTPLHHAAACGRSDTLGLLLSRGADAGAVDGQGRTPLGLARDPAAAALLREAARARAKPAP